MKNPTAPKSAMPRGALLANESPWLNEDGSLKSNAEIKELGKAWPSEVWMRFFKATEDGHIDRNLVFVPSMDTSALAGKGNLADLISNKESHPDLDLNIKLKEAMRVLSRREKLVIKKLILEGRTTKKVARQLKIKPSTVRVLKKRGIEKMKKALTLDSFKGELSPQKKTSQNMVLNPKCKRFSKHLCTMGEGGGKKKVHFLINEPKTPQDLSETNNLKEVGNISTGN